MISICFKISVNDTSNHGYIQGKNKPTNKNTIVTLSEAANKYTLETHVGVSENM